jgi:glyoxylase-like metal-dependent hydrolase (beta-lactamase superfamily II)
MLSFVGIGSAFHTEVGNNCAYFIRDRKLFMFDCGSTTFSRLLARGLLNGIEHIYVLMTHTHADHVGSLGDLVFYSYFSQSPRFVKKITIVAQHDHRIPDILQMMGVGGDYYDCVAPAAHLDVDGIPLEVHRVRHAPELACYAYVLQLDGKTIYYSGDSVEIPDDIRRRFLNGEIDMIYQDTATNDHPLHLSLNKLAELIPEARRSAVYCMHFDNEFDPEVAHRMGFQTVTIG